MGGVEHLSPAHEVRDCGIESQVSWVTDAPPSREQVQRGAASGFTARPVHTVTFTRQMDERDKYFYTHLCKSSLPRGEVGLAHRYEECTCMDGPCQLVPRPCRRGHHVPSRTEEQEFTEREVQAHDSNGGGNVRALRVVHEQCADTDDPVGSRSNLDGIGYLW